MKSMNMQRKTFAAAITILVTLTVFLGGCAKESVDTSPSIQWLNGTYAVLTQANGGDVGIFGGMAHNSVTKTMMLDALASSWEITTKAEMDEMIDSLAIGRHNPRFLAESEEYGINDMSKSEFDEAIKDVEDRLDTIYFQNMFDAYQRFGEKAILGWDLSRAVQLCADGYIADLYTYEEATDKAREIGKIIQNEFDSWDDFYDSYLYGYVYWSEDDTEDANSDYVLRVKVLNSLKEDEKSPLALDWNLDLSK